MKQLSSDLLAFIFSHCFVILAHCNSFLLIKNSSSLSHRADWLRDQCAPLYIPRFRNGWEPPVELFRMSPWETECSDVSSMSSEDVRNKIIIKDSNNGVTLYFNSFYDTELSEITLSLQYYMMYNDIANFLNLLAPL